MRAVEYEWDEAKRAANRQKHGGDFSAVFDFDWRTAATEPQTMGGEARALSFGVIGDRLHALVWTTRDARVRVISLRRASRRETLRYAEVRDSF